MRYTVTNGVAFIEDDVPFARQICPIEASTDSMFFSSQLQGVESVKKKMASRVIELGGNCVIRFTYGQKQTSLLRSFFSRDDVYWYGNGIVAVVDPEAMC